jgi:hypothetical protein
VIRRVLVSLWLAAGGCTAEFLVGDDAAETGTTDAGSTGNESTTGGSTSTTSSSTSTTDADASTTEPDSTSAAETTTSGGQETTDTTTNTTGALGCGELGYEACVDHPECIWDGIPRNGVCVVHPCEKGNPNGGECWDALEGACNEMVQCEWFGDLGPCAPILCEECQSFGELDCMELPQCEYNEGEMLCVPV